VTEEKRTLIETFLPVDEISEEAKKEKNGRAPTFEMHYWWTRKPLITARAAVLGALLPADFDPQEFKKLLGLEYVKATGKRAHNYDIPLDRIEQLKKEYKKVWGEVPTVLDPFAGGGSIPFEAMRVGVDAVANDYNPVAHLIEKATLEYPRKYGDQFYQDVEKGLNWIFEETKKEMEQYYPKHEGRDVVAYIWAWSVKCPKCGFDTPLVGQWWLIRTDKKKVFIEPTVEGDNIYYTIKTGSSVKEATCTGGKGHCLKCGSTIEKEIVQSDIREREKEVLIAKIVVKKGGKDYVLPNSDDISSIQLANETVKNNWDSWVKDDLIPLDEIPKDTRGSLSAKIYLNQWHRLLNNRQKLLFVTLLKKIQEYYEKNPFQNDADCIPGIILYLSFIFGKHLPYNCRSASWHRTRDIIASTLSQRGVGMMWDHVEVNPFIKGSGSLQTINSAILEGLKYSMEKLSNHGQIKINNQSMTTLNESVNLIVTDPPYFDDVRYAEFSEFFYSWERKALIKIFDLGEVPKSEEMSVGGWGRTNDFFFKLFALSSKRMNALLKNDGILVMFFAHSSVDAWDFVINSLQNAGFRITATWPVHTENTNNPLARGNASIMSSIIIVARKRKSDKTGYIEEIKDEVRDHLMVRLDEFWKYGLRGADLTVSAMGATLDVITQYSDIKSYTGEMKIEDVLKLVQEQVAQYVLNRYMKNASGLDAATSFYLYTRLSQLEGMPFDTANLIAKSMNADIKSFADQGLIKKRENGKAQGIIILNYANREINGKQSLIDCVQFVMATFARGGFSEVERELATIPFSRNEIKDVLEALLSLPTEDPERQVAQKILERMGQSFPKQGQTGLDNF
jgi:adenine-specific DNA methylase